MDALNLYRLRSRLPDGQFTPAILELCRHFDIKPPPAHDPVHKTLGILSVTPDLVLVTIECPWFPHSVGKGGTPNESCVPAGSYTLHQRDSGRHGQQWHLVNHELDVFLNPSERQHQWQRFWCMFHIANYAYQLKGCTAPGMRFFQHQHYGASVASSAKALWMLNDALQDAGQEPALRIWDY